MQTLLVDVRQLPSTYTGSVDHIWDTCLHTAIRTFHWLCSITTVWECPQRSFHCERAERCFAQRLIISQYSMSRLMDCSVPTCIHPLIEMETETGKKAAEQGEMCTKTYSQKLHPSSYYAADPLQVLIALSHGVSFSSTQNFQRRLSLMHFGGGFRWSLSSVARLL